METRFITAADFQAAVGRPPQDDDLERCNCPDAGRVGHLMCGWNDKTNLPIFMSQTAKAEGRT